RPPPALRALRPRHSRSQPRLGVGLLRAGDPRHRRGRGAARDHALNAQQRYDSIAAEITDGHQVVASKMFGMPTLKVGGKAFAGLFGESMSFKLGGDELAAANRLP